MYRYAGNSDLALKDPFGGVLPPCIVMEKGESLQDRAQKSRIDVFTAAQVLLSTPSSHQCSSNPPLATEA